MPKIAFAFFRFLAARRVVKYQAYGLGMRLDLWLENGKIIVGWKKYEE